MNEYFNKAKYTLRGECGHAEVSSQEGTLFKKWLESKRKTRKLVSSGQTPGGCLHDPRAPRRALAIGPESKARPCSCPNLEVPTGWHLGAQVRADGLLSSAGGEPGAPRQVLTQSPGGRTETLLWGSHLSGEVVRGHFHPQKHLEGGRPGEAVLKQEAVLLRDEEGQDPHVHLGERDSVTLLYSADVTSSARPCPSSLLDTHPGRRENSNLNSFLLLAS